MSGVEIAAVALGCGAVIDDLRRRSIANWLTGSGLLAGLLLALWSGGGRSVLVALGGAVLGFVLFWIFYRMGGLGGGDVKLMAAFGAMLGPANIFTAAILAAIAGALMAVVVSVMRPREAAIPYAPAIVAGVWLVLLGGGG